MTREIAAFLQLGIFLRFVWENALNGMAETLHLCYKSVISISEAYFTI